MGKWAQFVVINYFALCEGKCKKEVRKKNKWERKLFKVFGDTYTYIYIYLFQISIGSTAF